MVGDAFEQLLHRQLAIAFINAGQRPDTCVPGAKVLGGEVLPHGFAQILVDVTRSDRVLVAIVINIFEQMLAWQILHFAHHSCQAAIGQGDLLQLAALPLVAKPQGLPGQFGVAITQGGGTETLVGLCIPFVPNPDRTKVEQSHDARDAALSGEVMPAQIAFYTLSDERKQAAEGNAAIEFFAFSRGAEIRVIPILFAAFGIDAGREDMTIRRGAEPGVDISRRKSDSIEPALFLCIADKLTFGIVIGPSLPRTLAGDSRQVVVDIDELRHGEGKNSGTGSPVPHLAVNRRLA